MMLVTVLLQKYTCVVLKYASYVHAWYFLVVPEELMYSECPDTKSRMVLCSI